MPKVLACMALFDLLWEALFAVFDGHGGSQVSHIASKEFPKAGHLLVMLVLLRLLELSLVSLCFICCARFCLTKVISGMGYRDFLHSNKS